MRRKKIRTIVLAVLAMALLLYELFVLKGENYYYVSLAILLIGLYGFFAHFEQGRPDVLLLTMIASLCALAIAGRIAFFFLPQVKPILAIVILSGIAFGGEVGFVTGAMSAFVSNFYFGQGSWTPFQMFALGLCGFVAGVLFAGRKTKRWIVAAYGFFAAVFIYGGIVDINTVFFTSMQPNAAVAAAVYLAALPFNLILGVVTAAFLFVLYRPILNKLRRIQEKYSLK
jgi:energy-coupling factor transport system substrate-specific component